ncbi:hypothetical protein KIH39_23610 [Telmatocola sphagniphila]|uniref:Uncharacterized protein n=1 Tax=Telmatocola sphagniphila TaxID=1123043 RepID=A0A8E6B604_9BACT|nr:hypothetical protein [Telmatocola sphagniphila]QVL31791.1 hypothetical protein KIH39_23610 [Telmatocola sphagniphila]
MIVPQYWAEARVQNRQKGRQITLRRFGWSDVSQLEAQDNANARAQEALLRILSGEKIPRRELKVPYNGAQGVPIREEVISRFGDTVITRNSYGARCLNTPNVLFADVDFKEEPSYRLIFTIFGLLAGGALLAWNFLSGALGVFFGFCALWAMPISRVLYRNYLKFTGGSADVTAKQRLTRFAAQHPDWNLRVYRTPAGFRILVTHQTFNPSDPDVREFFQELGTDPVYALMCWNQQCFRARLSAKPWRVGIEKHLGPRPGVWPIAAERMPMRNEWIAIYEEAAQGYAACAFLETIGSGVVHPDVRRVLELHDELSGANSQRPIA